MVHGVVDKFIGCYTIGEEVDVHPWFMVLTVPLVRCWCSSLVYSACFSTGEEVNSYKEFIYVSLHQWLETQQNSDFP